jgi:uncharacterized Zn finger protein
VALPSFPNLTRKRIETWSGERSFARGQDYFKRGAIFDAKRQGSTLKARRGAL